MVTSEEEFEWNGEARSAPSQSFSLIELQEGHFLIQGDSCMEVFVADGKLSDGVFLDQIELQIVSDRDKLVRSRFTAGPGVTAGAASSTLLVKAPMPGMVRSVRISVGDSIEKGMTLIVLEAMKMENNILAPKKGIVRKIFAKDGSSVEKNMILCEIEAT